MKNITYLRSRNLLTEQQVLTAYKYSRDPNSFNLSPTIHGILRQIIIESVPLETIEKQKGWSARSAKTVLSVLLYSMEETRGMFWDKDPEEARDTIEYLSAEAAPKVSAAMQRFGATRLEARVFTILDDANGECVPAETIHNRLYHRDPDNAPQLRSLSVVLSRLRKKVENHGYAIETLNGIGVKMTSRAMEKCA